MNLEFACQVDGCRHMFATSRSLQSHMSRSLDSRHIEAFNALYSSLDFSPASEPTPIPHPHLPSHPPHPPRDNHGSTPIEDIEDDLQMDLDFDVRDDHSDMDVDDPARAAHDARYDYHDRLDEEDDGVDDDTFSTFSDGQDFTLVSDEEEVDDETVDEETVGGHTMIDDTLALEITEGNSLNRQGLLHPSNIHYLQPPEPMSTPTDSPMSTPPDSPVIRCLDDVLEARVIDWHETAGAVIADGVQPDIRERWERLSDKKTDRSTDTDYAPFSSQLDWEIALWAVRENIGQGSLNRLLAIPGVR